MYLTKEQVSDIIFGKLFINETEDGYYWFSRFTEKQRELIAMHNRRHQTYSGSGMFMEIEGSFSSLDFDYRLLNLFEANPVFSIEIMMDGAVDREIFGYSTEPVVGHIHVDNPEGKRVTIRFPWRKRMEIKNVEIIGEYRRGPRKTKMLILGDSITHGTYGLHSSLLYASQLSDGLMVDSLCQAIGGDLFYDEQIDEEIDFRPDVITVAYGTNDWSVLGNEECIKGAGRYFEKLRRVYPDAKIIYFQPIYRHITEAQMKGKTLTLQEAREGYAREAEKYGVMVVNSRDFIPHALTYFEDGLHPNDLGFTKMGPKYVEAVKKLLPEYFA